VKQRRTAHVPEGWKGLLADPPSFRGRGAYPIAAYSEFMPAPRVGPSPYGAENPSPFDEADPWGWQVAEHEEAFQLRPGLEQVASQLVGALARLGRGRDDHGISRGKRTDNPYWPQELAERAGALHHERYVVLSPLALSRTQDDKGRVRWTLFGGSEQGSARPFWRGFFADPGHELPPETGLGFLQNVLKEAYGESSRSVGDLRRAGLRVLPQGELPPPMNDRPEGPLPSWVTPLLLGANDSPEGVKYLLTFRPFALLPEGVRRAYLSGRLHLLPFPGSLLFWGVPMYQRLRQELPLAIQIALLNQVHRHEAAHGLRVPQAGWLHEPRGVETQPPDHHGPVRNTFRRTHRTARVRRDSPDEALVTGREDRMAHVLFDTSEAIGLYGKPMARNAQLWSEGCRLILDGPPAGRAEIDRAAEAVRQGGLFGYRFVFPAVRVGGYEVYWHRPLAAYLPADSDRPRVLADAPLGYLTAYRTDRPDPAAAVELWPRLLRRAPYEASLSQFTRLGDPFPHQTSRNCRKVLDARAVLGSPLPPSFARALLTLPTHRTLGGWLDELPGEAADPKAGRALADELRRCVLDDASHPSAKEDGQAPDSWTLESTSRRPFEVAYWNAIAEVSGGRFPNRNNADCARDAATRAAVPHVGRDLDPLGEHLLARHARSIEAAGLSGRALAGSLRFHWRTDFDFDWSDGWRANQGPEPRERDLIVMIPGRDRRRAVIMADHYDTAYMEDRYKTDSGQPGPRLATPGSDDNTSATAALLMAAPVLLGLSRDGRLGCDVWLVHLTGEEFPADCLGARHLAQSLVEGDLEAHTPDGRRHRLSGVRVEGVFVLDMVAHDSPRHPGVFQIAPGASRESLALALEAHRANEAWNAGATRWDRHASRKSRKPAGRGAGAVPPTAPHPVMRGEVRPHDDPHSTLYNTDGQIFSDAGIPVVLFMEDYDIDRSGYHDSKDTMAGIDLAYGAALVAIAVESVARTANRGPSRP
jgi:hypothetical protein